MVGLAVLAKVNSVTSDTRESGQMLHLSGVPDEKVKRIFQAKDHPIKDALCGDLARAPHQCIGLPDLVAVLRTKRGQAIHALDGS